jgi:nitrate/nitrite transport system permease protein
VPAAAVPSPAPVRAPTASAGVRAFVLSVAILALVLVLWQAAATRMTPAETGSDGNAEYDALVAGTGQTARIPAPGDVLKLAIVHLRHPFYDRGPNDKGIGLQLLHSLGRVLTGYLLALLVAVPLGFVLGMSPVMMRALDPFIQVLKPISPLAWMPLALFTIEDSARSAIFVIFVCSLWPVLINTAFGVGGVSRDYLNVARTLELGRLRTALTVILPAAAPTILTGMRISIGISWLVIVAAEMLVGGTGIGYYVWNQWNNLDLAAVIFAIIMIGLVGMLLDAALAKVARLVTYEG